MGHRSAKVGGVTPHTRVNPSVRPVTAVAMTATAAPVLPAGYPERSVY